MKGKREEIFRPEGEKLTKLDFQVININWEDKFRGVEIPSNRGFEPRGLVL